MAGSSCGRGGQKRFVSLTSESTRTFKINPIFYNESHFLKLCPVDNKHSIEINFEYQLYDFWYYRNDPKFVQQKLMGIKAILHFFENYQNADGSLQNTPIGLL